MGKQRGVNGREIRDVHEIEFEYFAVARSQVPLLASLVFDHVHRMRVLQKKRTDPHATDQRSTTV